MCCSDKVHCCPEYYKCNTRAKKCTKDAVSVPWVEKVAGTRVDAQDAGNQAKPGDVVCPGGKDRCPDGNTCCELPTGGYGCCPLLKVSPLPKVSPRLKVSPLLNVRETFPIQ